MENLTKQQIVLVTLLVSFVTSIATGIITVSLMDQAPPAVTKTINQVVERTIEKVVQTPAQSAAVVTKETVVVKEDDLVVAAVDKNGSSLVRIISPALADGSLVYTVALGLILTKDGLIVTDDSALSTDTSYSAIAADGKTYPLSQVLSYTPAGLALFKVKLADKEVPTFAPALLGSGQDVKLGQAVVELGGKDRNTVETGIVSSLIEKNASSTEANANATSTSSVSGPIITSIQTDISNYGSLSGDILMNLSAEVIGIKVVDGDGWKIIPASNISGALIAFNKKASENQNKNQTPNTAGGN